MRMERFYTFLGIFFGGAFILTLFSSIYFYDIYQRGNQETYVMFFKGSLEGLNVASTVTYNGVKIGEVKLIQITENKARNDIRIPVYVQFYIDKRYSGKDNPIRILMDKGYVANITRPNFVTGISSIELIKSDTPRTPSYDQYNGYFLFPTKNKVEEVVSLDETLKSAQQMLHDVSALVTSPKIQETLDGLKALTDSLNRLGNHLDQQTPALITTFIKTLLHVSNAANSIQNLTDYLSRNPEALLRGKV